MVTPISDKDRYLVEPAEAREVTDQEIENLLHGVRLADADEAEMHLLAVSLAHRSRGIGRALVDEAMNAARRNGFARMVLWTQPSMHAAQKLYERAGFVRAPDRDWRRDDRAFIVYQASL